MLSGRRLFLHNDRLVGASPEDRRLLTCGRRLNHATSTSLTVFGPTRPGRVTSKHLSSTWRELRGQNCASGWRPRLGRRMRMGPLGRATYCMAAGLPRLAHRIPSSGRTRRPQNLRQVTATNGPSRTEPDVPTREVPCRQGSPLPPCRKLKVVRVATTVGHHFLSLFGESDFGSRNSGHQRVEAEGALPRPNPVHLRRHVGNSAVATAPPDPIMRHLY